MALQKQIQTKFGTPANYWKIIEVNINWLNRQAHVVMSGYVSEDTRQAVARPIDQRMYDWNNDDFPFDITTLDLKSNNPVKIAYLKIKGLKASTTNGEGKQTELEGEFKTALDV